MLCGFQINLISSSTETEQCYCPCSLCALLLKSKSCITRNDNCYETCRRYHANLCDTSVTVRVHGYRTIVDGEGDEIYSHLYNGDVSVLMFRQVLVA